MLRKIKMKKISKNYQFTLVLKNADEETPHLEDSLFEAGCNDALINFRNDVVYLNFDREACSLEQAVLSAIKNVESASVGAKVSNVIHVKQMMKTEILEHLD